MWDVGFGVKPGVPSADGIVYAVPGEAGVGANGPLPAVCRELCVETRASRADKTRALRTDVTRALRTVRREPAKHVRGHKPHAWRTVRHPYPAMHRTIRQ